MYTDITNLNVAKTTFGMCIVCFACLCTKHRIHQTGPINVSYLVINQLVFTQLFASRLGKSVRHMLERSC